ncbi:hypothetical protein ACLB2K_000221 [Fragaria x ananassa]
MPKRNRSSSASSISMPSSLPNALRVRATRSSKIRTSDLVQQNHPKTSSSPLFCRKRIKNRMRSMEDIMRDDRSLLPGVGLVLGRPSPVHGRSDLSWTLLKSDMKHNKAHYVKLTQALHVMHECFAPSMDPVTHKDVAEDVIFNEEREFYTVVLEKGDKVATVANVRVHNDVAEAPLVATGFEYQRQGMCKVLMGEIEKWLRECGVERLVLPSVQTALKTWTSSSMGFETMTEDEKADLFIDYDCLDFQDTVMCQKQLILKKNKKKKKNVKCDSGSSSDGSTISHEDQSSKVAMSTFICGR